MRNITSIYDLYERLGANSQSNDIKELLYTKSWLYSISDFDPLTGEILPTDLISFLHKVETVNNKEFHKDYIYKIIKHSMQAFYNIIKKPRNKILREYNPIPIHSVREVDSKTIQWISMQQGRNIREKLSSSKNIKAIQRLQSLNTLENRLVKSLAKEILYLLDIRKNIFSIDSSEFEEFAIIIDAWLHQEDVQKISFWNGLTPNNTLLQDQNYKKIWDSWVWLKNIDNEIMYDIEKYHTNLLKITYWRIISKLHQNYTLEVFQQAMSFNYEDFTINISNGNDLMGMFCHHNIQFESSVLKDSLRIQINNKNYNITLADIIKLGIENVIDNFIKDIIGTYKIDPTNNINLMQNDYSYDLSDCLVIDICNTMPQPKLLSGKPIADKITSIVQVWKENNNNDIYVSNNRSKLIYMKHQKLKETISLNSILYDSNNNLDDILKYNASKEIISYLKSTFPMEKLLYLVPDTINDFVFENVRSAINFTYKNNSNQSNAKPLPNSIGAIFSLYDTKHLDNIKTGDIFIVAEKMYNCISYTPLKVEKDKEKKISFIRHPSISMNYTNHLQEKIQDTFSSKIFSILGLNITNELYFRTENKKNLYLPKDLVKITQSCANSNNIPKNISDALSQMTQNNITLITLNDDITLKNLKLKSTININRNDLIDGAIKLSKLETKNKKRIYWKDHLPALFTKLPHTFNFIKDQTIVPIRGKAISIKNDEIFTLPILAENTKEWAFPLYIDKEKRPNYQAVITKPSYVNQEIDAHLEMVYTYGNDMPFELYFKPINDKYDTMKVEWKEYKVLEEVSNLIPKLPESNEDSRDIDKYDKLIQSITNIYYLDFDRKKFDTNNIQYTNNPNVMFIDNYCLNTNFVTIDINQNKAYLYGYLRYDSKHDNYSISVADHDTDKLKQKMEKVIRGKRYFPINLWINKNYYLAEDTPEELQEILEILFQEIKDLRDNNNDFYDELLDYLCIFHQDMPSYAWSDILERSSTSKYYCDHKWKAIARAIGMCNQDWQKKIFYNCLTKLSDKKFKKYIIKILSVILWRNEGLYLELTPKQIEIILTYVNSIIKNSNKKEIFIPRKITKDNKGKIKKIHVEPKFSSLVQSLELLLNLIRLRTHDNKIISSKFNINSEFSLNTIEYIDNLVDIYTKLKNKNDDIASFKDESKLQLDLSKNKPTLYKNTPDLLYSIKMYLSGDDGANSIVVKGVIDK